MPQLPSKKARMSSRRFSRRYGPLQPPSARQGEDADMAEIMMCVEGVKDLHLLPLAPLLLRRDALLWLLLLLFFAA